MVSVYMVCRIVRDRNGRPRRIDRIDFTFSSSFFYWIRLFLTSFFLSSSEIFKQNTAATPEAHVVSCGPVNPFAWIPDAGRSLLKDMLMQREKQEGHDGEEKEGKLTKEQEDIKGNEHGIEKIGKGDKQRRGEREEDGKKEKEEAPSALDMILSMDTDAVLAKVRAGKVAEKGAKVEGDGMLNGSMIDLEAVCYLVFLNHIYDNM